MPFYPVFLIAEVDDHPKAGGEEEGGGAGGKGLFGSRVSRVLSRRRRILLDLRQNVCVIGLLGWFCTLDGEWWCSMDAKGLRVGDGMGWRVPTAVVHRGARGMTEPWLEGTERVTYCSQ